MNLFKRIVIWGWRRVCWTICWFFPINSKKLVITNYFGRGYGDNAKYIAEKLLESKKDINIIWLVLNDKEAQTLPSGIKAVKYHSFIAIYHLSTAKCWVDNCRKIAIYKKKKQFYLQTWHGFSLKRIERDVVDNLNPSYARNAIKDSKKIDLIVSDSKFMSDIYKNSFWYDGEVVEWGAPRNDILINNRKHEEIKEKICKFFNLKQDSKIVLYAPTFRSNLSLEPYSVDFERVKKACEQAFGGEFFVLVRLHPNIMNKSEMLDIYNDYTLNASVYTDMQELLAVSDVVISDYSSLMFDFALSKKPCFQFCTDIEEYKKDRDLYFSFEELPFALAVNNDELEKNILTYNEALYQEKMDKLFKNAELISNGNAAEKCAELILRELNA